MRQAQSDLNGGFLVIMIFTPEVTGNTITFIAPKLYQLDSDVIEVTVDVSANGLSSGTYAFNVFVKNQNTFGRQSFHRNSWIVRRCGKL